MVFTIEATKTDHKKEEKGSNKKRKEEKLLLDLKLKKVAEAAKKKALEKKEGRKEEKGSRPKSQREPERPIKFEPVKKEKVQHIFNTPPRKRKASPAASVSTSSATAKAKKLCEYVRPEPESRAWLLSLQL